MHSGLILSRCDKIEASDSKDFGSEESGCEEGGSEEGGSRGKDIAGTMVSLYRLRMCWQEHCCIAGVTACRHREDWRRC